jgi:hypothetical protein
MRRASDNRRKERKRSAVDHSVFVWRLIGGMKMVTCSFFRVPALVDSLARERLVA